MQTLVNPPVINTRLAPTALVFLHGAFGSPYEYKAVLTHFKQLGYACYAPSLPGHGRWIKRQSLQQLTHQHFLQSVYTTVQRIGRRHSNVVLVGHSLGGLLALYTGARPNVAFIKGVAALAAPFNQACVLEPHHLLKQPVLRVLASLRYLPDYWHGNPKPKLPLSVFPHLKRQSYALFNSLQQQIPNIAVPVLLTHSPYDLSIPFEQLQALVTSIEQGQCCPRLETVVLKECGHQIFPLSKAQPVVLRSLERFITSLNLPVGESAFV